MPESTQRHRLAWPGLLTLALFAAAGTAGWLWRHELAAIVSDDAGAPGSKPRMTLVETAPVARRLVEQRIAATGTLLASEAITITARTRGRVTEVRFSEGDAVTAGEPLIVLERTRAQAQLQEAEAQRDETRSDLKRLRTLRGDQFISESRLEQASAAADSATAALTLAEQDLEDRVISAPFAGVVGRRLVSPGALLEPGTAVADLRRNDPIDLLFDVPETAIGGIAREQRVRATTPALPEQTFEGELTLVGTALDEATRTLPLEATFANPHGLLKPGMFMQVTLITGERELLSVPEAAVIARGPTQHVFAVERASADSGTNSRPTPNPNGRPGAASHASAKDHEQSAGGATALARRRAVETGTRRDGWVEIDSGLTADARVVVAGLQGLRDGAKVQIKPAVEEAGSEARQESSSAAPRDSDAASDPGGNAETTPGNAPAAGGADP